MVTPISLPLNCLMEWNNNKITDHNRDGLSVSTERIENVKRMANGTLRKYVIADKRTFSVSWAELPHDDEFTVDGFWGGRQIEAFYAANAGPFTLKLTYADGTTESITVVISSFRKSINKRGAYEFWDADVEMQEV